MNAVEEKDIQNFTLMSNRLIMNADLNAAGKLFGGRLMAWIDEAAALFAMVEMKTRQIVTKKFSEIVFNEPALLGDVLEFRYRVKAEGTTSMTIECIVPTKVIQPGDGQRIIIQCDVVFVALDRNGRPTPYR